MTNSVVEPQKIHGFLVQVKGTSAGHCEPLEDVQPARNASEPMAFQPGIYIYKYM